MRLEMNSVPEEIDQLDRHIRQLEIEREAIRRENDKERISRLDAEIEDRKSECAQLRAKWQSERNRLAELQQAKEHIEQAKIEAQRGGACRRLWPCSGATLWHHRRAREACGNTRGGATTNLRHGDD